MKNVVAYGVMALVLFLVGFFIARYTGDELKTVKRTQILLGTVVEIQIRNTDEKKAEDAITKAFAEIKRIDNLFTTYNEESPVRKLNNSNDSLFIVDKEIFGLMVLCDSLWRISDGSFDVAIESLIRGWGFDTKTPEVPNHDKIKSALKQSGWKNIQLLDEKKVHRKEKVGLNFGAIAKGYAVDRSIEVLIQSGITEAFVNAGGEIKTLGNDWIAGIQHPRNIKEIVTKIGLNGISVATSGDYENYFEKDGVRYHHILNPKTGYSAGGIQSVTVIHKNNAFADGIATAVFVMRKTKGLELIESLNDTEVMIIDDEGKIFYSSGFEKFLIN
ncbi:MAG TPA: FAD:protein FMN transferase [Ignavibacteriaceae bacterium]|nr:FAD:protein FMN transferase [Ignavibacteriaceae bacterium]